MIETRAAAQKLSIFTVSLTTTGASQNSSIPAYTNFICINNPDTAIAIKFSFDNTNYATIAAGSSFSFDCADFKARNTLYLKSASGTPTAEVICGYEA